ncbi:MAG: hypothetical protein LBT48_04930 [Prevotellaceae bacterium]|jgi:hypothetical protein|nr:hypothetical protein [Prevotellaceae bacterium]
MKQVLFTLFMLASVASFAQTYSELRPSWAKTTPNSPSGANYFLSWGAGEGSNEQQAINNAWADALRKSLNELGVIGITNQDIDAVAEKGIEAVVTFNQMKRRILCSTEYIRNSENPSTGKVYVLIQVQRSVHGKDDFYDVDTHTCSDSDFDKKLAGYKRIITGDYGFSARAFVPGMAQFHKGSNLKGGLIIGGEVAFVGGIIVAENLRASNVSKINTTHNAADKQNYINNADNYETMRNVMIGGAVAIYVYNVIDAIAAKGKKRVVALGKNKFSVTPFAAPSVDGMTGGLALSYNF